MGNYALHGGKDFSQPIDPRTGEPRSKYARGDWDPNDPDYPIVCKQCGQTHPQRFYLLTNTRMYLRKEECIFCLVENERAQLMEEMLERKLMRAEQRRRKDAKKRRREAVELRERQRQYAQQRDKEKGQPHRYRR